MTEEKVKKTEKEENSEVVKTPEEKKPEKRRRNFEKTREEIVAAWDPKTKLGKEVKDGKIKNIVEQDYLKANWDKVPAANQMLDDQSSYFDLIFGD